MYRYRVSGPQQSCAELRFNAALARAVAIFMSFIAAVGAVVTLWELMSGKPPVALVGVAVAGLSAGFSFGVSAIARSLAQHRAAMLRAKLPEG